MVIRWVTVIVACLLGVLLDVGTAKQFKLSREGLEILLQEISPECNVEIQREIESGVSISPHCEQHIQNIIDEISALRSLAPKRQQQQINSKQAQQSQHDTEQDQQRDPRKDNQYINAAQNEQSSLPVHIYTVAAGVCGMAACAIAVAVARKNGTCSQTHGRNRGKKGKRTFKIPKRTKAH